MPDMSLRAGTRAGLETVAQHLVMEYANDGIRRFTRLSLDFSKKLENLQAAIALFMGAFPYLRRGAAGRLTRSQRRRRNLRAPSALPPG